MSNQPPYPGSGEPPAPQGPPQRPPYGQPAGPPQGPPPGTPGGPPPGPPPGHPGQPPYPPPGYTQPIWQGHQAPQQVPGQQAWQTRPYGAPGGAPKSSKGLVIGLVAVLVLLLAGASVTAGLLLAGGNDNQGVAVSDLSEGDCLRSDDIAAVNEEINDIETTGCNGAHDAEVFAVLNLAQGEDLDAAGTRCVELAEEKGHSLTDLGADDLEIRPLVAGSDPQRGDEVVCFIRNKHGDILSEKIFEG